METKINDLNTSEKEIEVTLSYDEIKDDINAEVKKQTKKIQIPGFRKGKVPLSMLKKMYGDALEYEASEKIANSQFWKIAKEKEINPIGQPKLIDIKFNPNEDLQFKVQYETYPVLDVKDYQNNEIEVPDFKVSDEEIQNEINYIRKSNSTQEEVEVVGEDSNFIIDVEIQRLNENDEPLDKPENIKIDLSNPGVNSEILKNAKGKKIGENFSFTFSDENIKKDDGAEDQKKAESYKYQANIKSIKKIILPELNEELIKKVTKNKVSTEVDLKEEIRKDIQNYYNKQIDDLVKSKLINLIIEKNDFEPPKTMVQNILNDLVKHEEEHAKKEGNRLFDKNEAAKNLESTALLQVKWFLLKSEIEKKENITVSDEILKELAKTESEKIGLSEEKLLNYYQSSNYKNNLIDQKLFEFLKEKNTIKKVDPETFSKKEKEIK